MTTTPSGPTFPGSDINRDGYVDLLWNNSLTGDSAAWYMSGTTLLSSATITPSASTAWNHAGMADFNGDGVSDLLWRNSTTGQVAIWYLNTGGKLASSQLLGRTEMSDWRIVGVGDFNGDQKADILWSNATSGNLKAWYMNGATFLGEEAYGNVSTAWQVGGVGDFNNDGHNDIVWQNRSTGSTALWYMNGSSIRGLQGSATLSITLPVNTPWQLRGTGDFDNDGHTDLFWWNTQTGALTTWLMRGATFQRSVGISPTVATSWRPLAQSRGGLPDLTVENLTGLPATLMNGQSATIQFSVANRGSKTATSSTFRYYLSNDTTLSPSTDQLLGTIDVGALRAGQSATFSRTFTYDASVMGNSGTKHLLLVADAAGTVTESQENNNILSRSFDVVVPPPLANPTFPGSDINRDGNTDLLWRNSLTGANAAWAMSGTTRLSSAAITSVSTVWAQAGMADFNDDGISDILWHNSTTGQVAIWYLNASGQLASGQALSRTETTDWQLVGVGDFNGDQSADILWRNTTSGNLKAWYMNRATFLSEEAYGNVSTAWAVGGVGDFNNDGNNDIAWHNRSTGGIALWYMNGSSIRGLQSGTTLGTMLPANTPWQLRGTGDFDNDGHTDLFWWNSQTGALATWFLKDASVQRSTLIINDLGTSWRPLAQARGGQADLAVNNAVAPTSSVTDGSTVNVSVDVANQGTKTSQASTLKYYLSENDTFDASTDQLLGEISTKALLAGESTTLQGSFTYDTSTMGASGTQYLFFVADANGVVAESNEQNNLISQTITVVPPTPLNVDLTLENVVVPNVWAVGNDITISVDVLNQGSDGVGGSQMEVYLLNSDTFDPTAAPPILTLTVDPIAANSRSTETFTFAYLERYGTGPKYLYLVADADGAISETDETNNVASQLVNVSAVAQSIDFTITNISVPTDIVTAGQFMPLSVTVFNQGTTPSGATEVGVYLSNYTGANDQLNISTATFVTFLSVPALNGSAGTTIHANVPYSLQFGEGEKNIFFMVDPLGQVTELDETNNVAKDRIDVILPDKNIDLFVSSITMSRTSLLPGETLNITAIVQNKGNDPTGTSTLFRIYLSDDEVLDTASDTILTGVSISNLASGASSQLIEASYTVPGDAPVGTKYIFFQADVNNVVLEVDEVNNTASRAFTINEVLSGVDLIVSNASVSETEIVEGESLTVNATVQNQGTVSADTSKLAIYVSSDANFDGSDRLIAEFDTGTIDTNGSFILSPFTFIYEAEYGLDARYILVVADHLGQVEELNDSNNVEAFAINVLLDENRPDLLMNSVEVVNASLASSIDFQYVVSNQGVQTTTQPFTVRFYLSDQNRTTLADIEANALFLSSDEVPIQSAWGEEGSVQYTGGGGARVGDLSSRPNYDSVWTAGTRYLIAVVDYGNVIRETNENNNIYSMSFTLG